MPDNDGMKYWPAVRDLLKWINDQHDPDKMGHDIPLTEYGFDSMDFFELSQELSERHGIEITDKDYPRLTTISGILCYLNEVVGEKAA
ncbi:MAG: acyl carrier protein [Desulfobulbaceae bacterium]|nr:acyl carrier protein [Desulfobulbaceae bacterium]